MLVPILPRQKCHREGQRASDSVGATKEQQPLHESGAHVASSEQFAQTLQLHAAASETARGGGHANHGVNRRQHGSQPLDAELKGVKVRKFASKRLNEVHLLLVDGFPDVAQKECEVELARRFKMLVGRRR
jgi:hypothetical protein